jgi:hypothetical protein
MTVTTSARPGKPALTVAILAAAAIAAAVLPVVAGIVFLVSLAARRPLMTAVARRWPVPRRRPPGQDAAFDGRAMSRLTAVWGITLLAAGGLQGLAEVTAGLTITDPAGFTVRTLLAVAVEAVLIAGTVIYLRRQPRYSPSANKS